MILKNYINNYKNNFLIRSMFTVASLDMINKILKSILTILLIRFLTIDEYSQYTLFLTISTFVYSFFGNGLYTSYTLRESERISKTGKSSFKLYKINFYIVITINVILILGSLFITKAYENNLLITYSFIYSLTICILELCKSYYLVNKQFKESGKIVNNINIVLTISLTLVLLLYSLNLPIIIIMHIIITGFFGIKHFIKILNEINANKEDLKENDEILGDYYKSSFWIIIYMGLLAIFNQTDIFIIKAFLNDEAIAIYGVSFKYYTLMLSLLPAIKTVLKIRTTQKDMVDSLESQKNFLKNWIRKTSILIIPSVLIIIFISPIVLEILNGEKYNGSILPFQIFCIGIMISYIFSPSSNILMALKEYKFMTLTAIFACIFNLIGNLILVNLLGISGVVITTVVSHAIINIASTLEVIKL